MEYNVQKLADMGRFEDDQLAHVATGEMIVPPVISPTTRMMVEQDMLNQGMNPNQYIVGGSPSINPQTGLQEFFIKKLFKKIKKVVKKVAPIAVNFIPGVGPVAKAALTAAAGKASGLSTKEALLGGALSFAGGKMFGGAGGAGQGLGSTGRFSRIKSFFNPAKGTTGMFGGKFGPGIRRGLGGMFRPKEQMLSSLTPQIMPQQGVGAFLPTSVGGQGGGFGGGFQFTSGSGQTNPYQTLSQMSPDQQQGFNDFFTDSPDFPGLMQDPQGNLYDPSTMMNEMMSAYQSIPSGIGSFFRRDPRDQGGTPQIIKSIGDVFGFGGSSGPSVGFGSSKTPGAIKGIEDKIKGIGGGNTGLMGLAALYGLATKKAAEKTEGGLRDIRLSIRPDLMPQQVFQGFDAGVRPGMQMGNAVFDINKRNRENESFAFRVLGTENPSKTILGLDEIDKQKFEHGLIMGGEFTAFARAVKNIDYEPSRNFQNILIAQSKQIANFNRTMAEGGPMNQELDLRVGGPSIGPGTETSDDIPALLSDGEFVMTSAANKGLGGFKIEKNKDSLTIFPTGKPDREQGFKNNDKMMQFFENYQDMMS